MDLDSLAERFKLLTCLVQPVYPKLQPSDTREEMRWLPAVAFAVLILIASAAEKPVALYKGLGVWQHAIATNNPEAQKFFDKGLTLAWSFNRYEALRSFRRASELDPQAVMPYW